MNKRLRTVLACASAVCWCANPRHVFADQPSAVPSGLPPLRTGDIVFQTSGDAQALAIGLASRSPYTHTALIEIDDAGHVNAVEAVGPVRTTPLEQWIKQGTGRRILVKRVKGLDAQGARKALAAAHTYDGRPYDYYFYKSRDAIYCSELVHLAFKEGAGISVGAEQQIKDLDIDNAAARGLIKSRWREYPLCRSGKAKKFDSCYAIILQQTLVTPASIARDPKLETVYSNFGLSID